jgi:hypothetical protein
LEVNEVDSEVIKKSKQVIIKFDKEIVALRDKQVIIDGEITSWIQDFIR